MKKQFKNNLSKKNRIYVLEHDEYTNRIIPRDNEGIILNVEQINNIIQELKDFKDIYNNDYLNAERDRLLQESNIRENKLLHPPHKAGYVFIYKEHITNKYRLVATQDYRSRIVTLQYEYPTSLEVIVKKKTTDVKILKEIMTDIYQKYHSHENWFDLTKEAIRYFEDEQYQQEFNDRKTKVDYRVYDSIVCGYCNKEVTNLVQDSYFICMACKETYCSEECLVEANHKCK